MGKSKQRKRYGVARAQPTGLLADLDMEAESEESSTTSSLVTLLDQLQSPEEECRLVACTTVATIVAAPGTIPVLMEHNLVRILAPLLIDPNVYIQNSAVGALRNLSVDGGVTVCEKMVEKDVLTSLIELLKKYGVNWEPEKLCEDKTSKLMRDTYTQAVHVLWNLCENSDTAVRIFNKDNLVLPLVHCLRPALFGYPLVLAVAHCLHAVTENNPEVCTFLKAEEPFSIIQALTTAKATSMDALLLKTVATGLLVNIVGEQLTTATGHLTSAILSTVAEVLAMDTHKHLMNGADTVIATQVNGIVPEEDSEPEVDKAARVNQLVSDTENLLKAQQIAVEIAANLCCSEDDEEEELDSEESLSSDEMVCDVDMEPADSSTTLGILILLFHHSGHMGFADYYHSRWTSLWLEDVNKETCFILQTMVATVTTNWSYWILHFRSPSPCCLPSEMHEGFVKFDILGHVLNKIECPELSETSPLLATNRKLNKCVYQLRVHALLSAANIISALTTDAVGGIDRLHNIWIGLVRLCSTHQDDHVNIDHLEAVSSTLRAVAQKCAECKTVKMSDLMSADSIVLFEKMQHCQNQQIRINSIRILSSIGTALLSTPATYSDLKPIGLALAKMASQDESLLVVAEALDAIFDIFAEDDVDPVLHEINLLDKLRNILSTLKSKAAASRGQKRKLKNPVISTAKLNLVRFIKYKSTHAGCSGQTAMACDK